MNNERFNGVILHGDEVNHQQVKFFNDVMSAVERYINLDTKSKRLRELKPSTKEYKKLKKEVDELTEVVANDYRIFHYGGSIRGGKTIICLTILVVLCKMFPGSRWVVIRKSYPVLISTSVESLKMILMGTKSVRWSHDKSNYFCEFANGSRIRFVSENYQSDKHLTAFLGLEINGALFEQIEELQEKTFDMVKSRCGSWKNVKGIMPPPICLSNFNPSFGWVNDKIDKPGMEEKLEPPNYFLQALSTDNPFNTKEQWRNWENLDDAFYRRMILGERTIEIKDAFMYAMNDERNIASGLQLDDKEYIWLSFDFNVDPMTCVVMQTDSVSYIRFLKEFRIENSDTYEMCEQVAEYIKGNEHLVLVTGDASGQNRMAGVSGHINQYQIIKEQLGLMNSQFRLMKSNPGISDSRTFCNAIISKFPCVQFDESMEHTIRDLKYVVTTTDKEGNMGIKKSGVNPYLTIDNSKLGHLLDCVRYALHASMHHWLKLPKS